MAEALSDDDIVPTYSRGRRFQKLIGFGIGTAAPVPIPVSEIEKKTVLRSVPDTFNGTVNLSIFSRLIQIFLFFCMLLSNRSYLLLYSKAIFSKILRRQTK